MLKNKDGKLVDEKWVENSKTESVTDNALETVLQNQKSMLEIS